MTTLTAHAALDHAARTGAQLHKYADPTEGARAVNLDEAREIARVDASLIYCETGDDTMDAMTIAGTEYHVTRRTGEDLYGHATTSCDASGCAGHERYLGTADEPDTCYCGGCGETVLRADATLHSGVPYCAGCEAAPAEAE